MNDRRRGLGRGLGALIPQGPIVAAAGTPAANVTLAPSSSPVDVLIPERRLDLAERPPQNGSTRLQPTTALRPVPEQQDNPVDTGAFFTELPVQDIRPNPRQPRQVFDEDALAELVASIREVGLLQPVVVRPVTPSGYELVMGERRWRAVREAGLRLIPAIVRPTEDGNLLRDALLENLHRSELNPLEEAAAYDQLLQDFNCTHDELAQRLGRSRPQITNTLRLLRLSPPVQRRVAAGVLSAGHARALLGVAEAEAQDRLAERVVSEGLSVRALEEIVAMGDLAGAPSPRRRASRALLPSPQMSAVAGRLSDRLDTRVSVDLGKRKGKIIVEFATLEDLDRLVELMAGPIEGTAAV